LYRTFRTKNETSVQLLVTAAEALTSRQVV